MPYRCGDRAQIGGDGRIFSGQLVEVADFDIGCESRPRSLRRSLISPHRARGLDFRFCLTRVRGANFLRCAIASARPAHTASSSGSS